MSRAKRVLTFAMSGLIAAATAYVMERTAPDPLDLAAAPRPMAPSAAPQLAVAQLAPAPAPDPGAAPPQEPALVVAATLAPVTMPEALPVLEPPPRAAALPGFDAQPRTAGFVPSLPGGMPFGGLLAASLDGIVPVQATGPAPADCDPVLTLTAEPAAMIGLTLTAPCHAETRAVLRHAGLAVSVLTDAQGQATLSLPAFEAAGGVIVTLPGNTVVLGGVPVTDLDAYRRVAVQWQGEDEFVLNVYENGADWGADGHLRAEAPGDIARAVAGEGGVLSVFDGGAVDWPLMAQVYTMPRAADASRTVIEVEVPITETTCNREMMAETLVLDTDVAGIPDTRDVSVTMPECAAAGGYLLLNNLFSTLNIAAN